MRFPVPVQSPAEQVEVPAPEQLQKCDDVAHSPLTLVPLHDAARPTTFEPSLVAASCIPGLSDAVMWFCAPYATPARAALETSMPKYARRPNSAAPTSNRTKIGSTRASSTKDCPRLLRMAVQRAIMPFLSSLHTLEFTFVIFFIIHSTSLTNVRGVELFIRE